jgi:hypothetical protein
MSRWKSTKVTTAALLAVGVTIPAVHESTAILHNAAFSNALKSPQSNAIATRATARGAQIAVVTHNERNLGRRQRGVDDERASSDPFYPSSPSTEPRESPSDDRQKNAASLRTYRTVCVRLCDGYFFPISFAVSRRNLARDARRCQESCGTEARLFYHSDANADIADMTDLEGQPYSKLESAFLYRTTYFPNCKCHAHPWEKEATERHRMYALVAAASNGDKAAAEELDALHGALNQGQNKDAQPAPPTFRPPATNRPSRVKSATTSSEKPNAPAAADWREKAFQSRN